MKVLVVHDREEAKSKIIDVFIECGVRREEIYDAEDTRTASELFGSHLFDCAVLDLTLQYKKGHGEPHYRNVENLLVEIFETSSLRIPADIIGITKEPLAAEAVSALFSSCLLAILEEDEEGNWAQQLKLKLGYVAKVSRARQDAYLNTYDVDVCIVTALDSELQPYERPLNLSDNDRLTGCRHFVTETTDGIPRRGVAYSIGRSGQATAASAVQVLITKYRPKLIVMSGICGGIKGKVKLGDVIIFKNVFDWDYGKWGVEWFEEQPTTGYDISEKDESGITKYGVRKFFHRPTPVGADSSTLDHISRRLCIESEGVISQIVAEVQKVSDNKIVLPKVYYGPVASGSAVIADEHIIPRIKGINEDILAADMEAYGFYHASKTTSGARPAFLCVKAVSDYCDRYKNDGVQQACCFISSSVVMEIIDKYFVAR